jgi:hypothetical protein
MKVFKGYNNLEVEICLIHPDYGNYHTLCTVNYDDYDDSYYDYDLDMEVDKSSSDFDLELCQNIWNAYNSSGYYHEMIITTHHIIDNVIYYITTSFNGYEVTNKTRTTKTIQ